MRYLLDTATWLWSIGVSKRLNSEVLAVIKDPRSELYFSAVTSWEISIKFRIAKLQLPEPPLTLVPKAIADQGLRPLAISHAHTLAVSTLPLFHGDPFDRLLIAQAQLENMVILTADAAFRQYDVKVMWSGQ
jgi:PIN domain nuclease of toxin-antitoxin system